MKRKIASKKVVKRKKRVDHKIVRGLKQAVKFAQQAKVAAAGMSPEDAAMFDIPLPPDGMTYQWASTSRLEHMLMKGWSRVPYSRHPELPRNLSFDGYIVHRDNTLFQIAYDAYVVERDRLTEQAKNLVKGYNEEMGKPEGRGFFILSPSFVVSSDYERTLPDAPPVPVEITITMMVPARWQDAAGALQLDHAEYARRRLTEDGMMIAADHEAIFHPFTLTTRKVD